MKRLVALVIAVVLAMFQSGFVIAADEKPIHMGVITGGAKGTYYQFGLNIQKLSSVDNINMEVYNSAGSVENVYAVYKRPRTQLGIVQSDVLAFVSKVQTDETLKQIAKKIKMVFPLYNEEIHLLGQEGIDNFDALSGKRVAIGKEGSGTYLTARLLFEISGIHPLEMVTIGTERALSELKAGNIDAMFYVAGLPVALFKESVSEEDQLNLIPITNKNIREFYPSATIPPGVYEWQDRLVETVAVKAVLISFDFKRFHCKTVGRVAKMIYENMDWLKENGHSKWKSVDLNYRLKGWEQYGCVRNALMGAKPSGTRTVQEAPSLNPVLNAIKKVLKD